jgi:hypothetical protein
LSEQRHLARRGDHWEPDVSASQQRLRRIRSASTRSASARRVPAGTQRRRLRPVPGSMPS